MAVTVAVLCLFGAYLTVVSVAGADPNDPGLVQVALFGSPFLAAAAAFVTGLMLTILGALRLVELTLARALVALVLGLVGAPIGYLVVFVVTWTLLGNVPLGVFAVLCFMLPVVCGIGSTLIATTLVRRISPAPYIGAVAGLAATALFGVGAWAIFVPASPPASAPAASAPSLADSGGPLPELRALSEVAPGWCFDDVVQDQVSLGVRVRSCDTPHEYEMLATETYPAASDSPFPGDSTLSDHVYRFCSAAFTAYVGVPPASSALSWSTLNPSETSWSDGDRWIGCLVGGPPPATPLVGSVKGTKR